MKVAIFEYGVGNLFSVMNALKKIDHVEVKITNSEKEISSSDCLILPGVGNFSIASGKLQKYKDIIKNCHNQGKIIFGICLGLQLFFDKSEESSGVGLELLSGNVGILPNQVKIPHMGWNNLRVTTESELFENIVPKDYFYFNHSYIVQPIEKSVVAGETMHGTYFPSVVIKDNIIGTQFHPEKSSKAGKTILKNLLSMLRR